MGTSSKERGIMSTQIPVKTTTLIYTLSKTVELGNEAIAEMNAQENISKRDKESVEAATKETREGLEKVERFIKILQEAIKHPAFNVIKVEMEDFDKFGLLEYDIPD
jgi:S-adenosylmethionine/arginine decarboxylase-like enzyme